MGRVSVIVPAYNAATYLAAAIESVIRQTYQDWEVIIVDDGSSDETGAVACSYASLLPDKIRYVYQPNRGLPAARNIGIRIAQGEFVALLDADDVWLPLRLERSVAALKSDAGVGLVHARVARINEQGHVIDYPFAGREYQSGRIARHIYTRRAHIMCPTVTFRMSCVDKGGPFDETLRAAEDRDLWFRIAQRFNVAYVDEVLAYYRLSPTSMSGDLKRMLTADLAFVDKHYRAGSCTRRERLQALGTTFRGCGDFLFKQAALGSALKFYLKAVVHDPFSTLNLYMLARAAADPVVHGVVEKRNRRRHCEALCVKMQ
jgi:glycosyltransferase involved in cell wall biosynthesis